jgi:hypothetical protein
MKNVEVIKIGEVIRSIWKDGETIDLSERLIMTISEDINNVSFYYLSKLKEYCQSNNISTVDGKGIVPSTGSVFSKHIRTNKNIFGIEDAPLVIDQSYTISNGAWHSSKVKSIISEYMFITKNSVYAIHDLSIMRSEKLKDLGIGE